MNEKLLGLLRRQEWLYRDQFERAAAANKAACDAKQSPPNSQVMMVYHELNMLRAQIELEREEAKP
jgi:hypothetical protein